MTRRETPVHEAGERPEADPAGPTGVPDVDAARARLERIDELPVAERAEVLDGVHQQLQDALARLDEA